MATPRQQCYAAVLPDEKLIVIGGETSIADGVEIICNSYPRIMNYYRAYFVLVVWLVPAQCDYWKLMLMTIFKEVLVMVFLRHSYLPFTQSACIITLPTNTTMSRMGAVWNDSSMTKLLFPHFAVSSTWLASSDLCPTKMTVSAMLSLCLIYVVLITRLNVAKCKLFHEIIGIGLCI